MVVAELLACALTSTDPFGVTERVVRTRAPECLAPTSACASSACGADAAAPFFAAAPQSAPRLEDASGLRVFFLEGHPGPMNDMMSTLHDVLGVRPDGVEGMVLLQGCIQRNHIDRRFFRCRNCRMGTNVTRQLNQWLSKSKSGRTFCLIGCEKHRCLNAVHDDTTRREFARLFGAHLEATYDAVACNFPSWQCALFMYVNVAVIMRFTHRFDHHIQGAKIPLAGRTPDRLLARDPAQDPRRSSWLVAEEAGQVVRAMARDPKVVLAASNAYDYVYLKRNLGLDAVPWPGLSAQLAPIRYSGADAPSEAVLFCCGASPYNRPITQWADAIKAYSARLEADYALLATKREAPGEAPAEAPGASRLGRHVPRLRFAWLGELYPKSWDCKTHSKTRRTNATEAREARERERGSAAAPDAETRSARRGSARGAGTARTARLVDEALRSFAAALVRPKQGAQGRRLEEKRPQCGYRYEDVASHPLAVLLPYSAHSYGLVNAYAMGLPLLAPSLRLLSAMHASTGVMNHKGPNNLPWRSTPSRPLKTWTSRGDEWHSPVPAPTAPCCASEPNDACDAKAAAAWMQFADWYVWPHVHYFDTPEQLAAIADALLRNSTRRRQTSRRMKAHFASEARRTEGHVRVALHRALQAAREARASFGTSA